MHVCVRVFAVLQSLEASMHSSLTAVQHYVAGYEAFREMVVKNR